MAGREDGPIGIPHPNVGRLKCLMRPQPSRRQKTGDGARDVQTHDQWYTSLDVGSPVAREHLASERWLRGEEGVEDGELVEGEADCGRGGREWEDEPQMGCLRLERGHCVLCWARSRRGDRCYSFGASLGGYRDN